MFAESPYFLYFPSCYSAALVTRTRHLTRHKTQDIDEFEFLYNDWELVDKEHYDIKDSSIKC